MLISHILVSVTHKIFLSSLLSSLSLSILFCPHITVCLFASLLLSFSLSLYSHLLSHCSLSVCCPPPPLEDLHKIKQRGGIERLKLHSVRHVIQGTDDGPYISREIFHLQVIHFTLMCHSYYIIIKILFIHSTVIDQYWISFSKCHKRGP